MCTKKIYERHAIKQTIIYDEINEVEEVPGKRLKPCTETKIKYDCSTCNQTYETQRSHEETQCQSYSE